MHGPEPFDPREERLNTLTHGLAAVASVGGLIILIVGAGNDALKLTTFSIYGVSLIVLFGASALYHGMHGTKYEVRLQIFDHAAIYLLIAGTYTPFMLLILKGAWGWSIFGVIWGMALLGMFFKFFGSWRGKRISAVIYLIMGWLVIIAINPLIERLPPGAWKWVIAGGLSYTIGVVFYLWQKLPYNHVIWHLFVMGGAAGHYFAILFYLVPV